MTYRYVLRPEDQLTWLSDVLAWRGRVIASLVPEGAATVLRLRHPAYRRDAAGRLAPVTWAAAVPGRAVPADSQFSDLVDDLDYENGPRAEGAAWDVGPAKGAQPRNLALALAAALPWSSPGRFAVWAGWASVPSPEQPSSLFTAGHRSYHLLSGTAEDVAASLSPTDWRTPNLWWDDSRTWLVHTDIDRADTFIGASSEVANRVARSLAAYEVSHVDPRDPLYP